MGLLSPYRGTYVNAELASDIIDAEGIISSANSIKGEISGLGDLAFSISSAGSQLSPNDLTIGGLTPAGNFEETSSYISNIASSFDAGLDGIISSAEAYYNQLQEDYNNDARIKDQIAIENARNKNK